MNMENTIKTKPINVRVGDDLAQRMAAKATQDGTSVSELVRRAVEVYLTFDIKENES